MDESSIDKSVPVKRSARKRVSVEREADLPVVRTTRQRATRESSVVTTTSRVTSSPVRSRPIAPTPVATSSISEEPVKRKAPTPLARMRFHIKERRRQQIVLAALILAGIGASAAVGYTDHGQINVAAEIDNYNNVASGEVQVDGNGGNETRTVSVPVQAPSQHTAATLRGRGTGVDRTGSAPTVAADTTNVATASSTETTASSTEESVTDTESEADKNENENEVVEDAPPE